MDRRDFLPAGRADGAFSALDRKAVRAQDAPAPQGPAVRFNGTILTMEGHSGG